MSVYQLFILTYHNHVFVRAIQETSRFTGTSTLKFLPCLEILPRENRWIERTGLKCVCKTARKKETATFNIMPICCNLWGESSGRTVYNLIYPYLSMFCLARRRKPRFSRHATKYSGMAEMGPARTGQNDLLVDVVPCGSMWFHCFASLTTFALLPVLFLSILSRLGSHRKSAM